VLEKGSECGWPRVGDGTLGRYRMKAGGVSEFVAVRERRAG